jgi:DNA replication protein DnaC
MASTSSRLSRSASSSIDGFEFNGTPINESLVRDVTSGNFIAQQRNVVLVGGTDTGKTHLAMGIARACIRAGSRGRSFNTVDQVNRLEAKEDWPPGTSRRLSHTPRLGHPR